MKPRFDYGMAPLVLGVTGHRDLPEEDKASLRRAVLNVLTRFSRDYPNTPCLLLSGLAEGADLLAAECVLEFNQGLNQGHPWGLYAMLAAPVDEFAQDFTTPEAEARFRSVLSSCNWVHVVSKAGTPDPDR